MIRIFFYHNNDEDYNKIIKPIYKANKKKNVNEKKKLNAKDM